MKQRVIYSLSVIVVVIVSYLIIGHQRTIHAQGSPQVQAAHAALCSLSNTHNTCDVQVNWPEQFSSANYEEACTILSGGVQFYPILTVAGRSQGGIVVQVTYTGTSTANAGIDCIGVGY